MSPFDGSQGYCCSSSTNPSNLQQEDESDILMKNGNIKPSLNETEISGPLKLISIYASYNLPIKVLALL